VGRPHVVIVGGGFGGVAAAQVLRRGEVEVTVIDRHNHFVFQPLLYQVASGSLAPSDIAVPIRWYLRKQANTRVLLGEVTGIDLAQRRVTIDGGRHEVPYDFLIVATGTRHAYFGHDEWEPVAPGLKSLGDALEMRSRFLNAFEQAELCDDEGEREAWQTIVIVGGGPTGAELAGIMVTIAQQALRTDFRRIDTAKTRVILVEGGARVLPTFPEALSARALEDLERMGVDVRLNATVSHIDGTSVRVGDEVIRARTVFWAAGNVASPLTRQLGAPLDRFGRVLVSPDLSLPGRNEVFVVGDIAVTTQRDGRAVPGVAQGAIQGGACAGDNVLRTIGRRARRPFRYVNKGDMATLGRHRAIADLGGRLQFSGVVAWLLWLFIHIMYLAGFRNRIVVLNAAAGAALTMALTDLLPIDRFIHPMPPVLSGTYWLAIHVPIIMVGYAVLALGMVVAHMQIGFEAFAPDRRALALKMAELQYFYIHVGSILLVAGILTGSMWAASSWGRYWGWDPKEVWSLVAFLAYMAILHARAERLIGTFGVAAWSIVAFQTILMTYLGVNFVLAAGLHSYGFGDSSVVRAMVITAVVEGTFIAVAWARLRKRTEVTAA